MSHTFAYQIGILYFDNNIERVENILGKMLETDGFHISFWTKGETASEDDNMVSLYNFIRNQCEHTVLFVTPGCKEEPFFLQAIRAQVQQKKLNRDRSFLVIECGRKLPVEYKTNVVCIDGDAACGAELAMQIEDFFYPKQGQKQEKEFDCFPHHSNIVVADVIKDSKFF